MATEIVTIDNGVETDWIDPVVEVRETADAWLVDNGYGTYEIEKRPGRTVIERSRAAAEAGDDRG